MPTLKDLFFNESYYKKLSQNIQSEYPSLNKSKFMTDVMDGLQNKELNQRLRHTSTVLRKHLPEKYADVLKILDKVIEKMDSGYSALVFPDFVSQYGLESIDLSLKALKKYTVYGSSEFALREFYKKDFQKTLQTAIQWSVDKNEHVRRLSSEGSRPRLPWSFKLNEIIKNPKHTSAILQNLKADPSLYVRKSVANHLNDISKDHPDYMLELVSTWDKSNDHTQWIIKHACRTLIKKGHANTLKLFDVKLSAQVKIMTFDLKPKSISLGGNLEILLSLKSTAKEIQKIIIDYIIHYVKKKGITSPKVFKWKEISLAPGQTIHLNKKQRIIDFSTRVHHAGSHKVELQINGKIMKDAAFDITLV